MEPYAAPEIHELKKHYDGKKIDIFAAAVILFTMLGCEFPFGFGKDIREFNKMYNNIKKKNYELFWSSH